MKKADKQLTLNILENLYKGETTALNYGSVFQLLVAVILSAQCTDERVNKVTPPLFEKFGTPEKMANITLDELISYIKPCGYYNAKAKNIILASKKIVEDFGGEVPSRFEDLITLAGVGRKTADVMIAVAFSGDAIPVDTHVFRVSNRIGLVKAKNVLQTELQLQKVVKKENWSNTHHYILWHGRRVCKARNPDCENCKINLYCDVYAKNNKN